MIFIEPNMKYNHTVYIQIEQAALFLFMTIYIYIYIYFEERDSNPIESLHNIRYIFEVYICGNLSSFK